METRKIAGHDLIPGKTVKDHIHVKGTTIMVPHVILKGSQEGPTLLVTAGIHNSEFVGIQAAIELSNEIGPEAIRGTLMIIPLANRSGFENRTMSLVYEDGKNLNRVFPGDDEGTAADRLAHILFNTFILHADAYIDLHSGDGYEELMPYVYYVGDTPAAAESESMAECVNTDYYVCSSCKTGGAYNLASMHGIPSILIERGQLSLFPREQIDEDKNDVVNIMRMLGMLDGSAEKFNKTGLEENELFSPASGCWYPELHAGDSFRRGDPLGTIRDYFGNTLHVVFAEYDGIILHQCASLNIVANGPMLSYGVLK
ncbi:MAG: succinylglutamate desuccinylase/aspartoacylase family protein [Oscillospiraceae bacterium]|nr:succinylglutamate desuccinylase/aspartoacylase family protein [Oscillospiraceae bacterium]